jgi:5-methylcytosine-specific restriction endonuclease McrA
MQKLSASSMSRKRGRPSLDLKAVDERLDEAEQLRCPRCPSSFSYLRGLRQHIKYACYQWPRFQCPYCPHRSKYRYNVYNHVRQMHKGQDVYCLETSNQEFPNQ